MHQQGNSTPASRIEVPEIYANYVDAALLRLGSLYPEFVFHRCDNDILIEGVCGQLLTNVRRDVLHTVYREKIYTETLSMRRALVETVTRR